MQININRYQQRLQQNLIYLATIADCQPNLNTVVGQSNQSNVQNHQHRSTMQTPNTQQTSIQMSNISGTQGMSMPGQTHQMHSQQQQMLLQQQVFYTFFN